MLKNNSYCDDSIILRSYTPSLFMEGKFEYTLMVISYNKQTGLSLQLNPLK